MGGRKPESSCPGGVLPVNKPVGPTSHDVVDCVRRLAGVRKVGHTGTLDPAAQG
ncbi:MAG TPA: tRNA pseudouridine(55) synthase TruB, partial [Candidatus Glassbacteria bacterium]|nr:tRNA pseudouridine(55) synthase TruB [Candidatus Glassbacteria bacterium]